MPVILKVHHHIFKFLPSLIDSNTFLSIFAIKYEWMFSFCLISCNLAIFSQHFPQTRRSHDRIWQKLVLQQKLLFCFRENSKITWYQAERETSSHITFLSSSSTVVKWIPPFWHLVEMLEILLLHVLSNAACKFAINLFPMSWESFENVNLLYFPLL